MIVFVLFMVDQFKIEFLRPYLLDYQHYIAAIFGMFASLEKLGNEARGSNEVQTAAKRTHLGNVT
jgi:hypothetical protein